VTGEPAGPARVRLPADVDQPDRIAFGLTARQLGLLAVPAGGGLLLLALGRGRLPVPLLAGLSVPLLLAALVVAVVAPGGLSVDRLAAAGGRYLAAPRRLVPAGGRPLGRGLGPVRLPAAEAVQLAEVAPVALGLASPAEQEALLAGFGRALNTLTGPLQILIRTEPFDLTAHRGRLTADAAGLPHPRLEAAARAHAAELGRLAARRPYRRRLLVVSRGTPVDQAGWAAAGLTVSVLSGAERDRLLAEAFGAAPAAAGPVAAAPNTVITGAAGGDG
jgi:hypothetical protein